MIEDFKKSDTWRVFRIQSELVEGFETLHEIGPSIAVFGGSRFDEKSEYYGDAINVCEKLSNLGFSIITGGGPGIMEAANKGAKSGKSKSVGLNIALPHEQEPNKYQDISMTFRYFFVRKLMFVKYSTGFVIFPGGFGTLDEFFEALTLVQTNKIKDFPIVLYGKEYWQGLVDWMGKTLVGHGVIDKDDMDLFHIVDDMDDVGRIFMEYVSVTSDNLPPGYTGNQPPGYSGNLPGYTDG
jgi:uncharacterized protein (TIGR00730 family)